MDSYNIDAEMTATARSGYLRFTFNNSDSGVIVIEPNSDENEGFVEIISEQNEIIGFNPAHRIYQGWGERTGFSGYFVAKFDQKFTSFGTYQDSIVYSGDSEIADQEKLGAFVKFQLSNNKTVLVKVGTSFTSIDEARKNLKAETEGIDFESAKENLKNEWNKILSRVEILDTSKENKIKFYTALYHSYQQPRLYNDFDGSYPSFAGNDSTCNSGNSNYYDDFSIWDTYRASHPLFNLLIPDYNSNMVKSLLLKS
ncbi:MAG: glycoside hydrolase family 92 protein [Ignavibacteriales bacterium]|nr:glycoside hydrolase family 92 protein [Ignavibacteriales bacterium]